MSESMGFCLDPCDYNMRIYGLAVRPFRGYPVSQVESEGYQRGQAISILVATHS